MCLEDDLMASENKTRPDARSTASIGTTKLSNGASSGIGALGITNAPVLISGMCGVLGDDGFEVKTTLAK